VVSYRCIGVFSALKKYHTDVSHGVNTWESERLGVLCPSYEHTVGSGRIFPIILNFGTKKNEWPISRSRRFTP
jgi:hypothetical protein